jgi:hypothetical protein
MLFGYYKWAKVHSGSVTELDFFYTEIQENYMPLVKAQAAAIVHSGSLC